MYEKPLITLCVWEYYFNILFIWEKHINILFRWDKYLNILFVSEHLNLMFVLEKDYIGVMRTLNIFFVRDKHLCVWENIWTYYACEKYIQTFYSYDQNI